MQSIPGHEMTITSEHWMSQCILHENIYSVFSQNQEIPLLDTDIALEASGFDEEILVRFLIPTV
jgi:hypothetical protein